MGLDIRIITGPGEVPFPGYLVMRLARHWKEEGHRVFVGPAREVSGDVAILHVDRTRVPAELLPRNPSGIPLLNGGVLDISKRAVSRNLVRRGDGYRGPVMIKTDANHFGVPEARARRFGLLRYSVEKALPWRFSRTLPRGKYPVLDTPDQVPDWVWEEDGLVVERFLPDMVEGLYALRMWIFFGRAEYGAVIYGREPVVKVANSVRWEYHHSVPDSLRAERERLGFDFGKFDYVERDGHACLLDANKTPSISGPPTPNSKRLADQLSGFLG